MEHNLNFLEACKALDEGRCKMIESEACGTKYFVDDAGTLSLLKEQGIKRTPKGFLGRWQLVNEKPQTEERTFKYWVVIWNDGSTPIIYYGSPSQNVREIAQVIAFCEAYIYTYPKC